MRDRGSSSLLGLLGLLCLLCLLCLPGLLCLLCLLGLLGLSCQALSGDPLRRRLLSRGPPRLLGCIGNWSRRLRPGGHGRAT